MKNSDRTISYVGTYSCYKFFRLRTTTLGKILLLRLSPSTTYILYVLQRLQRSSTCTVVMSNIML